MFVAARRKLAVWSELRNSGLQLVWQFGVKHWNLHASLAYVCLDEKANLFNEGSKINLI